MKTIKILLGVLAAMMLMTGPAQAARFKAFYLTQTNPTAGATGVIHRFNATLRGTTGVHTITMTYCTRASTNTAGVAGSCDKPESLSADATPTLGSNWAGLTIGDWGAAYAAGVVTLTATTDYTPAGADTAVAWEIATIVNAAIAGSTSQYECNLPSGTTNANSPSATCYIRVVTKSGANAEIDNGYVTYTVMRAVEVSATVDPTFTFVVQGVNSNVTTYNLGDKLTTSVSTAYNTLPFGYLQANIPKKAAHLLYVTTNTQSGYSITARLTVPITGVYGSDVDDFPGSWTANDQTWYRPTGQAPNTETAWFGANTTDTDISGGAPTALNFGGIDTTVSGFKVKDAAGADDGTTGTYVTYQMEANVFQPADTYTGVLIYNAIPKY